VPAVPQPSKRPKTTEELACNAAGGVFYTAPDGTTNCKKPTDSFSTVFGVSGCLGSSVTLYARGTGGKATFAFPQNVVLDDVPFGAGGGAAFRSDCSFTVYQGSMN
jgi:hypothetical protein